MLRWKLQFIEICYANSSYTLTYS